MSAEDVYDARSGHIEGVILNVYDAGQVQTVDVQAYDGVIYSGIEVWQPFGHASSAPAGATCILLAMGGDPANLRAFVKSPQTRFGGLARGESVLYGGDGSRVAVRQGGTVEILAATLVRVKVPNVTIDLGGTGTATILGNLVVSGDISDQDGAHGTLNLLRTDHNGHDHSTPSGTSGLPSLITP